jgi:beta-glucanase (GH16 family)
MLTTSRKLRRALAVLVSLAALGTPSLLPSSSAATASDRSTPTLTDDCGATVPKGDGTAWRCTFVDQCTGTAIDGEKWVVQDTRQTGFRIGRTCFTPSTANVRVRDGALELTAREGATVNCRSSSGWFSTRYTGGMVGTRGHFSQAFGRFEIRARFPAASTAGLHGGFWMYPRDLVYGPWPASGEIDVAEWWSGDATRLLPTLHYNGRDPDADSGWDCRVADPTTFHTYTVEWLRTVMRFSIDGAVCFARSWTPDSPQVAPQPFDQPFSMILNMGVGPASGTNKVSWRTPFPATLVVDYAKAWR